MSELAYAKEVRRDMPADPVTSDCDCGVQAPVHIWHFGWIALAAMIVGLGFGEYGCQLAHESTQRQRMMDRCIKDSSPPLYCTDALKRKGE